MNSRDEHLISCPHRNPLILFDSAMPDSKPWIIRSSFSKPRAIFFDLGNTLVTGTADTPHSLLAERLALTEKQAKKAGRILMTFPAAKPSELVVALKSILADKDPEQVASVLSSLWDEQEFSVREIDGAALLIEELKGSGFILCLISNTWRPYYRGFCRVCPKMASLFDFNILSFELGIKKPSQEFFKHALKLAGTSPSDSLIIGDSFQSDIEPARKLGCRAAWIICRPDREAEAINNMLRCAFVPPEIVVKDFNHLAQIIREEWL